MCFCRLIFRSEKLFALSLLLPLLAACESKTIWLEEVKTSDGTTIEIRRDEWRWRFASSSLPGSGGPRSQKLTALVPGAGKIVWKEDEYSLSRPLGFDVVDGTPWLLQENDIPCDKDPSGDPLRVFRYEKGEWIPVRMRNAPRQLEANLLYYSYAESKGDLGKRRYLGKCGEPYQKETFRRGSGSAAMSLLRYGELCGKALDDLADAVLRGGRNCSLKGRPRDPSFQSSWTSYLQQPAKPVEGRVAIQDMPAPALPEFREGVRGTYVSQAQQVFACSIGCKEDRLVQVIEYGQRLRSENVVEFLLAGPERRKFYAQVVHRPALLLCDQQGYKLLRLEAGGKPDSTHFVHAVHFNQSGDLVGKWTVRLPPDLGNDGSQTASGSSMFVHGLDVLDSELRIWIGRGGRDDACRVYRKVHGAYNVVEVRADK